MPATPSLLIHFCGCPEIDARETIKMKQMGINCASDLLHLGEERLGKPINSDDACEFLVEL